MPGGASGMPGGATMAIGRLGVVLGIVAVS